MHSFCIIPNVDLEHHVHITNTFLQRLQKSKIYEARTKPLDKQALLGLPAQFCWAELACREVLSDQKTRREHLYLWVEKLSF